MGKAVVSLLTRPESEQLLVQHADHILRKAGALGKLPTPIDDLIKAAQIGIVTDLEEAKDRFLLQLGKKGQSILRSAWQKIRGIADLKEHVIYVPKAKTHPRELFVKAHELGHQLLPWQSMMLYKDDDRSLRPDQKCLFEQEASRFAAEVIFQGQSFKQKAQDYTPSLDAIFTLADDYGSSRHAALRQFVEECDEPVAAILYWPNENVFDGEGNPILRKATPILSLPFQKKYGDIQLPDVIQTGHPWVEARGFCNLQSGSMKFNLDGSCLSLEWSSWWNHYCLFVLLRRKPVLHLARRILQ